MAIENVVSLIDFEKRRKLAGYLPTDGEVVRIGRAKMTFHHVLTNEGEDTGLIDINLDNDVVRIGDEGKFTIGIDNGHESIYRIMTIGPNATLKCNDVILRLGDGSLCDVYGKMILENGVVNTSRVSMIRALAGIDRGIINFGERLVILTDDNLESPAVYIESAAIIYAPFTMVDKESGRHPLIDSVIHNEKIVDISKGATIKINDPSQSRPVTVNDVIFDLHNGKQFAVALKDPSVAHVINGNQRIRFGTYVTSKAGGHLAKLYLKQGEFISGDLPLKIFKTNVLNCGHDRLVNAIVVESDAKLIIDENIHGKHYYEPSMIIGEHMNEDADDGNMVGGEFVIEGICYCNEEITIADGIIDIRVGGELVLGPNGSINFIDENARICVGGCLRILNIDQIRHAEGITPHVDIIHEMAGVIISNRDAETGTVLLDIPIVDVDGEGAEVNEPKLAGKSLYTIFENQLDRVEYHIPKGCRVRINETTAKVPFMRKWYNGDTLLQSIYHKWIVWHDDAVIEAEMDYTDMDKEPPICETIVNMFRTRSHTLQEKFQEVADAFRHAGAGNVIFSFKTKANIGEISFRIVTNVPTVEAQEYAIAADEYFVKTKIPEGSAANLLLNNKVENVDNIESFKDPKKNVGIDGDTKEARFNLDGNQD